jgi:hypothetical protein
MQRPDYVPLTGILSPSLSNQTWSDEGLGTDYRFALHDLTGLPQKYMKSVLYAAAHIQRLFH